MKKQKITEKAKNLVSEDRVANPNGMSKYDENGKPNIPDKYKDGDYAKLAETIMQNKKVKVQDNLQVTITYKQFKEVYGTYTSLTIKSEDELFEIWKQFTEVLSERLEDIVDYAITIDEDADDDPTNSFKDE